MTGWDIIYIILFILLIIWLIVLSYYQQRLFNQEQNVIVAAADINLTPLIKVKNYIFATFPGGEILLSPTDTQFAPIPFPNIVLSRGISYQSGIFILPVGIYYVSCNITLPGAATMSLSIQTSSTFNDDLSFLTLDGAAGTYDISGMIQVTSANTPLGVYRYDGGGDIPTALGTHTLTIIQVDI